MALLLTPGPLSTSYLVKRVGMKDMGSREQEFVDTIAEIRKQLLEIADIGREYDTILMQGSGTMGVESVINTIHSRKNDKVLVVENGLSGERIKNLCIKGNISHINLKYPYDDTFKILDIYNHLEVDPTITSVAVVHSETTSGLINPVEDLGRMLVDRYPKINYIVDGMSSFGGVPIDIKGSGINYLISSSNKCIQGLPGFSFVIANKEHLNERGIHAQTLSLDLKDQWEYMNKTGQFRFTPPVQSILSFNQAIKELKWEGGIKARYNRYNECQKYLSQGMEAMGFELYIRKNIQGPIITTFKEPKNFDFNKFYGNLHQKGYTIYNGKLREKTFRVGNIGHINKGDIHNFHKAVKCVLGKKK